MSTRGRPRKKYPSLDELPAELRLAIARVMVEFKISDIGEAYKKAALLLDINSNAFERSIQKEAENRYRSRHFKELNKARSTIEKNTESWAYARARKEYRIWGICVECKEEYDILPNSDSHKTVIEYLYSNGWKHIQCPRKRK